MSSKSTLFKEFIGFFNTKKTRYCLVGDTDNLPKEITSDIDIVVDCATFNRLPQILEEFCNLANCQFIQFLQHEQTALYCVLVRKNVHEQFIQTDFCSDYFRDGELLLDAEYILGDRIEAVDEAGRSKGFFRAAPNKEFIYYLLKKIDKQSLNTRQATHLSNEWKKDYKGALAQISRYWRGEEGALLAYAAENNEWAKVLTRLSELRKSLHKGLKFSWQTKWFEFRRIINRVLWPTGLFVVFLGVDGSGKSTVIGKIEPLLSPVFRRTKHYHLRPRLKKTSMPSHSVTDPHGEPVRGKAISFVKLLYWWILYVLGFCLDIYPRLASSTLVLFDRYYHDLAVDPQRYRYSGSCFLVNLVGKFIPKPDLWILLDAPAEVLYARKQEIELHDLLNLCQSYKEMVGQLPNSYVVNVDQPLDDVITQVAGIICEYLAVRTGTRMRNLRF